jgi:hypothetical protein
MAEIVSGLFGVSPEQLMRQRQTTDTSNAFKFAQLSPMERAQYSIYQGGAGLGRGVQGLLGGDAELERVSKIKQLSSQFDLTTPEGARDFAKALQPFAPQEAMMAVREAERMEQAGLGRQKTAAETTLAEARTQQAEAGKVIQVDLGDKIQLVNALTREIIREIPKGLTPAQAAKAVTGGGDGAGVAGPVGKSGAYRDADGIVYSASEMAKQRAGFQGLEKLADNLNSITETDIKNAESFIDYTQGETLKTIGGKVSPKTISAQSKINASQLLKQIESLPPGSASNADMVAAKSSFPGYGNAKNLETWVKNTKQLLADSMQRQSEQYGFKQKVQVKGLDGATPPSTGNKNQAALDWLKANPNDPRAPAVRQKLGI